jgi:hypothetical protein
VEFQDNDNRSDTTKNRASGILDAIDSLIGVALSVPSGTGDVAGEANLEGNPSTNAGVEAEVDPMEQLRADIALLRKQVGTVDKLHAQIAALPAKDEIVAAVLSRIPTPKCSCQEESGIATLASDPDCLAGIKPC